MSPYQMLEQAIFPNGQPNPIDEIRIVVISRQQFRWSLWRGGKEIFAGLGDADQVAGMTRATEQLVNTELGVAPSIGTPRTSLN
jgi:hypothetical protein